MCRCSTFLSCNGWASSIRTRRATARIAPRRRPPSLRSYVGQAFAFSEIGQVAIFAQDGEGGSAPGLDATCSNSNSGNYTIPYLDTGGWVYDPIWTSCRGASGATVTGVDVYYDLIHAYAEQ